MHFKNKVVWITGASSGIGAELARQLAAQNAKLVLSGRNEERLKQVQHECLQQTNDCTVLVADMLQPQTLDAVAARAISFYKKIDVVIFCAGRSQRSLAEETELVVYRQLMELNFFAPVILTKQMLPHFKEQQGGHIVAISSMAGLMGFPLRTGYAAAKHAVKGFFETLQTEHRINNLYITLISPGRVHTPISKNAATGTGQPWSRMDDGQKQGIPVANCAAKIIRAMRLKRKHVIIARNEKILFWIWWFFRSFYYTIARKKGISPSFNSNQPL